MSQSRKATDKTSKTVAKGKQETTVQARLNVKGVTGQRHIADDESEDHGGFAEFAKSIGESPAIGSPSGEAASSFKAPGKKLGGLPAATES